MRVLLLTYQWNRSGGLETVCQEIAAALIEAGCDVTVWSLGAGSHQSGNEDIVRVLSPTGIIRRFLFFRLWRSHLLRKLNDEWRNFDLVIAGHAHFLPLIKSVLEHAGSDRPCCWVWTYGIEVWGSAGEDLGNSLAWADKVISISSFTALQASKWVDKPIAVVPCMVDTDFFKPGSTSEINRGEILIVGRLSSQERYKGHDILLDCLPEIKRMLQKNVRLTIIGDGNDRDRLENRAKTSGISDIVSFRGRVSA